MKKTIIPKHNLIRIISTITALVTALTFSCSSYINAQAAPGDQFTAGLLTFEQLSGSTAAVIHAPGDSAFVNIPARVQDTSGRSYRVTQIADGAFRYRRKLRAVYIPSTVRSVGESAFFKCSSLVNVFYAGSKGAWKRVSVGHHNTRMKSADTRYNATVRDFNDMISGKMVWNNESCDVYWIKDISKIKRFQIKSGELIVETSAGAIRTGTAAYGDKLRDISLKRSSVSKIDYEFDNYNYWSYCRKQSASALDFSSGRASDFEEFWNTYQNALKGRSNAQFIFLVRKGTLVRSIITF